MYFSLAAFWNQTSCHEKGEDRINAHQFLFPRGDHFLLPLLLAKGKKNNKYNFIIYTSSTSPTIQLSSCKTTHCSKYHVAINPQILPIPLRCSIKPPPSHVPQIPIHPRSTQSTSYSSTSRCISTPTPSYHVERIPTPVPSLFSFFS